MQKFFIPAVLFFLTACSTIQPNQPTIRSEAASEKVQPPASKPLKTSQPTSPKIIYDTKTQNYIDANSAVQELRKCCPQYAPKILGTHCTVEKFIAGLNTSQIKINNNGDNSLTVYTGGTKIGNGIITIRINGSNAEIASATIGKIRQQNKSILQDMSQNICKKVEDKFK